MDDKRPCEKHEEQIKTLFKMIDTMECKVGKLEDDKEFMYRIDKNMAIQTEILKTMVEHNKKQDKRMDRQDQRMDEQQKITAETSATLGKLTENVGALDKEMKLQLERTEERLKRTEKREEEREGRGKIDVIAFITDIIVKVVLPTGIIYAIYKGMETFK